MPEDSKFAIMEQVVGQKRDDFEMLYIKTLALYLITNLGSRLRTSADIINLLDAANFDADEPLYSASIDIVLAATKIN